MMNLFSIVAKKDFLSFVAENSLPKMGHAPIFHIHILSPNESFMIMPINTSDSEAAVSLASQMIKEGNTLLQTAKTVNIHFQLDAIIGGTTKREPISYHIVQKDGSLQSFYPEQGESLYYARYEDDESNAMMILKQNLMMKGMSNIHQAQSAQLSFLQAYIGEKVPAETMLVEKPA
ncbi:hypothetical protein [Bacillus massilinigeriensis]|uniref:hypothetical protein n=1 Tax=Bacillus mediterraneensis TaxID=1805474 RepID=UPI0008F7EFD6|nr:hypothetical protein [Bacillus mediterraneensis]